MNEIQYFIQAMVIGGINLTIAVWFVRHFDAKLGAIIYALPLQFIIAYLILHFTNVSNEKLMDLGVKSFYGVIGIIIYMYVLNWLLKKYSIVTSLIISIALMVVCCGLILLKF